MLLAEKSCDRIVRFFGLRQPEAMSGGLQNNLLGAGESAHKISAGLAFVFRRQADQSHPQNWRKHFCGNLGGPLYLFLWIGAVYLGIAPLLLKLWSSLIRPLWLKPVSGTPEK